MTRCYARNRHGDRCALEYRHDEDDGPAGAHYYPRAVVREIDASRPLTDDEKFAYLVDEGGEVPCSRYGATSADCARVAIAVARILESETGELGSTDSLEHLMSLVVNDHDDIAYMLREYGAEYGIDWREYFEGD